MSGLYTAVLNSIDDYRLPRARVCVCVCDYVWCVMCVCLRVFEGAPRVGVIV